MRTSHGNGNGRTNWRGRTLKSVYLIILTSATVLSTVAGLIIHAPG